ncbi:MAG: methyltransferase [Rickettsiales bacterium]|nr:methyltransferase [Rickettsiales bacterium]
MIKKQDFFTTMNGAVKFLSDGYHTTGDAVYLAQFASVAKIKTALDVGIGTGGVALNLLALRPEIKITGLDNNKKMLNTAAQNAALNGRKIELVNADIFNWKTDRTFDAVITNPPYFRGSPAAHGAHHNTNLTEWTRACLKRVRPRGHIFIIVDTLQMSEIVATLHVGGAHGITIQPIFNNSRVLIAARTGVKTGSKIITDWN